MNASELPLSTPRPRPTLEGARAPRSVRSQAALVRALLDELERLAPPASDAVGEQLVEEIARLGCRCVELANHLAAAIDAQERLRTRPGDVIRLRPDTARC